MTKEFIPYKQALALKGLGFNYTCFAQYGDTDDGIGFQIWNDENYDVWKNSVGAPLYQQAFNWFREKYQLHATITSISQESWQWHITSPGESLGVNFDEDFYTYDLAQLDCLKELIKIAKKK